MKIKIKDMTTEQVVTERINTKELLNETTQYLHLLEFELLLRRHGLKLGEIVTSEKNGRRTVQNVFKDKTGDDYVVTSYISGSQRVVCRPVKNGKIEGDPVYLDDLEI